MSVSSWVRRVLFRRNLTHEVSPLSYRARIKGFIDPSEI
jgi:hypothetical protein